MIEFAWDQQKNSSNQRKHGLSFEAAPRVFLDPLCLRQQTDMNMVKSGGKRLLQ